MSETLGFCAALFLALYGAACLLHRLSLLILRPTRDVHSFSVAYLREGDENAEQIIRFFRAQARRRETLLLVDDGADRTQCEIAKKLCDGRWDVRFVTAENFVGENCI